MRALRLVFRFLQSELAHELRQLLFGVADVNSAQSTGTAAAPVVTAKIPENLMRAVAGRIDQSMPVGNVELSQERDGRLSVTVHGAPGFPYPGRRRVLSLRYLAADARHAPRRWPTSPPFDGLGRELAAGAVMDHPLFPAVWPA